MGRARVLELVVVEAPEAARLWGAPGSSVGEEEKTATLGAVFRCSLPADVDRLSSEPLGHTDQAGGQLVLLAVPHT